MSEGAGGIQITVNGIPRNVSTGSTIASLLQELALEPRGLAVERNLELVPRAAHADTILQPGDRVEVVSLVGGG